MPENISNILFMVLSALLGAVFGSFLNVVIYRLPLGMSLALPPSHCPVCGEKLKWYHNIPVLSYIFLRGKCAFCKTRISPRYIFVELLNCFLWLICYLLYGNTLFTFTAMIFLSVLICVFFIDSEHMIIPDSLNIIIALLGLILVLFGNSALSASPLDRILTAIGMLCFGLLLFFSFKFFAKKEAIGGGDIKFFAAAGLFLGWKLIFLAVFAASVAGCVFILASRLSSRSKSPGKPYPFGPFLAVTSAISMFFGNTIINFYVSLFN